MSRDDFMEALPEPASSGARTGDDPAEKVGEALPPQATGDDGPKATAESQPQAACDNDPKATAELQSLTALSCATFCEVLASRDPVPGGGGVSAMVGALAAALASMVARFTDGPHHAAVADEVARICAEADERRGRLLELVQRDADVFEPLSSAYAIPRDDPRRTQVVEREMRAACMPAAAMMEELAGVIELYGRLREVGSRQMRSDVGIGALLARAALQSAAYVIYADAKRLTDRETAAALESRCDELLMTSVPRAEAIAAEVLTTIRTATPTPDAPPQPTSRRSPHRP